MRVVRDANGNPGFQLAVMFPPSVSTALALLQATVAGASSKHATHIPPWLIHLGLPGLFVVSLLDAAIIPLPLPGSTDVLLLLLAAQHGEHPARRSKRR